jgi:transcriptional regulator with XRE-family HTH domain
MKRSLSFGEAITELRRERGLNQRQLASEIRKTDGSPISQQYLNDIENGRRFPAGEHLIEQLAQVLGTDAAFLTYVAGQMPTEIRDLATEPEKLRAAIAAFKKALDS